MSSLLSTPAPSAHDAPAHRASTHGMLTVPTSAQRPSTAYGVHSEVGRLHKVLVCRPGLAHRRLTPTNSDSLLFDDVLWVDRAIEDHADFVRDLRALDVEVVELHDLLADTMR